MPLAKTTNRYLKHTFSQDELNAFRDTLASTICELSQLEDEKKTVTSQFAARINEKKATSNMAAQNIRNGYEFRDIDCDVTYDTKRRMKLISRKDTGEFIEDLPMTADELQCSLPGFEFEDEVVDEDESDVQSPAQPEAQNVEQDDWIGLMRNAATANNGRIVLKNIETRIHDLQIEAGCDPMVGWVGEKLYRGIGVLKPKELGKIVKDASKATPSIGLKLSTIVDQLTEIRAIFERLLKEEMNNRFPTPTELIKGAIEEETDPDPAEPDESDSDETIDENPSF